MSNDLATTANQEYALAERSARHALEHARASGTALLAAKSGLEHGQWLPWLAEHWQYGERTARRLMRLAECWDNLTIGHGVTDLSLNDAMKLLANPPSTGQGAKPSKNAAGTPTVASDTKNATTQPSENEWQQRAVQAESELSAVSYANEGAETAAKRIVALEGENAALKAEIAGLREEVRRWRAKARHWQKTAEAGKKPVIPLKPASPPPQSASANGFPDW